MELPFLIHGMAGRINCSLMFGFQIVSECPELYYLLQKQMAWSNFLKSRLRQSRAGWGPGQGATSENVASQLPAPTLMAPFAQHTARIHLHLSVHVSAQSSFWIPILTHKHPSSHQATPALHSLCSHLLTHGHSLPPSLTGPGGRIGAEVEMWMAGDLKAETVGRGLDLVRRT